MFKKMFKAIRNTFKETIGVKPVQTHLNKETQKPKQNYDTETDAMRSAKRMKFITGDSYGSYKCRDCGAWHIGRL